MTAIEPAMALGQGEPDMCCSGLLETVLRQNLVKLLCGLRHNGMPWRLLHLLLVVLQ